jgi:hypothetical protein
MKTLEELVEQGKQRREEISNRERSSISVRRRHRQRTSVAGMAVTLVSYLVMLFAWHESWWYALISGLPGFIGGYIIASLGGGILRSMVIYSAIQALYFLFGYKVGGWAFVESGMSSIGGLIWTFMVILSWPVFGGLFGFLCETFDHDHTLI